MKKVLTIAVVALLATATVFAGVNFSGRFRQGYTFAFQKDQDVVAKPWKTNEAKFIIKASDDNGIWTVALKDVGALDSNDKWAANATVDFTKMLAAAGVDTGDFGLKISLGNNAKMTALSAYNDVTGNEYFKLKNNGKESMQLAMNYAKLVAFNVAFDPTNDGGSIVLSAKSEPVNGVAVSAAYAYNGYYKDGFIEAAPAAFGSDKINMLGFAADVNVAKLVDLDFKLGVTAYDNIAFLKHGEDKARANSFAAAVYGGVDMVDGFVEFTMANFSADSHTESLYGLNTQVNLNLVKDLALDVYYNIANLDKAGDTFSIGADASYKLAGVEFALNAEYAKAEETFSLTPKMIIVF